MTWGEFKNAIEKQGVKDDDTLGHVAWHDCDGDPEIWRYTSGEVVIDNDEVSYVEDEDDEPRRPSDDEEEDE